MHRSGTSALAGLLAHLGARAPKALMPGDANNPQGYWESRAFHDFHERLLRSAGSQWDAWTRVSPEWLRRAAAERYGDECRGLLHREFGDAPLFVLKDPRMCRLMPFWLPVLASAGIAATAALVVRDPDDVARSLLRRDALASTSSMLIWLRHVLEAEAETRVIPRTFVRCEDLLERWPEVAEQIGTDLDINWAFRSTERDRELSRFMQSGLRSDKSDVSARAVPEALREWVDRTKSLLLNGHLREISASAQALDEVRRELDQVTADVDGVAEWLEARRIADVRRLERLLAESRSELQAVEARLRARDTELAQSQAGLHTVETERDAFQARVGDLEGRLVDLANEQARLAGQVEEIYASKSWLITAPLRAAWGIVLSRRGLE